MKHSAKRSCAGRDGPQAEAPATPADKGRPTNNAVASLGRGDHLHVSDRHREAEIRPAELGGPEAVERGRAKWRGDAKPLLHGTADDVARERAERFDRGGKTFADDPARASEMAVPAAARAIGIGSRVDPEDGQRSLPPIDPCVDGIEQFGVDKQVPAVVVENRIARGRQRIESVVRHDARWHHAAAMSQVQQNT